MTPVPAPYNADLNSDPQGLDLKLFVRTFTSGSHFSAIYSIPEKRLSAYAGVGNGRRREIERIYVMVVSMSDLPRLTITPKGIYQI